MTNPSAVNTSKVSATADNQQQQQFICKYCSKSFNKPFALDTHLKSTHSIEIKKENEIESLPPPPPPPPPPQQQSQSLPITSITPIVEEEEKEEITSISNEYRYTSQYERRIKQIENREKRTEKEIKRKEMAPLITDVYMNEENREMVSELIDLFNQTTDSIYYYCYYYTI